MKKDILYAQEIKLIKVTSSIATLQAQGCLMRKFGIKKITAAKATDRIFNGTTDKNGAKVAPLLELSTSKTDFVHVDQIRWQQEHDLFMGKAKAQDSGVLVYLSSERHKRKLALI